MSTVLRIFFGMNLLIVIGCKTPTISGKVSSSGVQNAYSIYLIEPTRFDALMTSFEGNVLDSAVVNKDGNFRFDRDYIDKNGNLLILTLHPSGSKYPNQLENEDPNKCNYIPFVYDVKNPIYITSSVEEFLKNARLKSKLKNNDRIQALISRRYALMSQYKISDTTHDEENLLDHEFSLYNYQKDLVFSVTDEEDINLSALALRWASPTGDYERIPELIKEVCIKMRSSNPQHLWTKQICQKLDKLPLTNGQVIPDFELPMVNGDTTHLMKLLGSELTLIDFWASWCAPCRKENKNILVPMFQEFHASGFQIIGYALDSSEKGWKSAIEKDGIMIWPHASHLQGDISPLFDVLNMTTIPSNYLVNREGVILAKNLHGEALKLWVSAYFKNK